MWGRAPLSAGTASQPRNLVLVDTIGHAANGKVDYERLKAVAAERVAAR